MKQAHPLSFSLTLCLFLCLFLLPAQASQALTLSDWLQQDTPTLEGYRLDKQDMLALYEAHDFKPFWTKDKHVPKEKLQTVVESLTAFTRDHGLEEKRYPIALAQKLLQEKEGPELSIHMEVLISDWLIKIARELKGDRFDLKKLYPDWPFENEGSNPSAALFQAITTDKLQPFFDNLLPQDPEYIKLAGALQVYREMKDWETLPAGPTLKLNMRDDRVPHLRTRLQAEGFAVPEAPAGSDPLLYTEELSAVITDFQNRRGLDPEGNIGPKTLTALNVSRQARIDQLRANMARLRHMPHHYPLRYVIVNSAAATLKIVASNAPIYQTRVVLGRKDRRTPFIQSAIRSIIINPAWHVPDKIIRQDILPKLRKDPAYLEKMGFSISSSSGDGEIDWKTIKASEVNFRLRQTPGELNALGRIKFDFDNKYAVYLHGTPHTELFSKAERHLSSGCVRLKDPAPFAVYVLEGNETEWTESGVNEEIEKGKTRSINVRDPLPIYIIYQTAFFDDEGGLLNFRPDIYGYDALMLSAMANR